MLVSVSISGVVAGKYCMIAGGFAVLAVCFFIAAVAFGLDDGWSSTGVICALIGVAFMIRCCIHSQCLIVYSCPLLCVVPLIFFDAAFRI